MESDDNVSGEFQRSTRMPLDAVVRLHFQGTVAYQNGFAANVSATGMFVKHPAPPPLGTQLVFEFNLGAERKPVQGAGEVVWVREKYLGPGQPAGVGIRFLQLDSQSRDHIAEALFEYLEQSLAEDSLLDSSGFSFGLEPSTPGDATSAVAASSSFDHSEVAPGATSVRNLFAGADGAAVPDGAPVATTEPYSQPFDFAALEPLPQRNSARADARAPGGSTGSRAAGATGPATAEGRRAFSVFSPLDEADAQTADIVREALREEAPLPSMAAAAAASSAREGTNRWVVALVLALVAGGGYLAWQEWGATWLAGGPTANDTAAISEVPAPAPRRPQPLNAAPEPGTTLAQEVGVDPNAVSPAAAPPLQAAAAAPPAEEADGLTEGVERPAASSTNLAADAASALAAGTGAGSAPDPAPDTPSAAAAPAATAGAPPRPPAAPVEPATAPANAARAQRLTGIEWRESAETAGQTVLVLIGDGAFPIGSFSYSEIGGENPRVLIKLRGMQSPYRGNAPRAPEAGGAQVKGVRTGFHVTANGNEIHVVVDLARGGVKVLALEPQSAGLTLRLAP